MSTSGPDEGMEWKASIYEAQSLVTCSLPDAWRSLLDYQSWNPSFADSEVVTVKGAPRTEGEVVLIKKKLLDVTGAPLPQFFAETVRLVPSRQVVWYVYPKDGDSFRNFVDFRLSETSEGVRFEIHYYAQDRLAEDLLRKQRREYQRFFDNLAFAFKKYCEEHIP